MSKVSVKQSGPNVLIDSGLPLFFEVLNADELGFEVGENRNGQSVRTWVRSLSVMQKEAVVVNGATGKAWRLSSDEGPYLNAHDVAPYPLCFLTAGMIASYMNELLSLAKARGITLENVRLSQDNYYTMRGVMGKGTMFAGALPIKLCLQAETDADDDTLNDLTLHAIAASPLNGLMRGSLTSLFSLSVNGKQIDVQKAAPLEGDILPDPGDNYSNLERGSHNISGTDIIEKLVESKIEFGVAGGVGTSLENNQDRGLHLQAHCDIRPDGVKVITLTVLAPLGSVFQFLSDEDPKFGGKGLAPDAASYISAGIGFCFMTQLGRYAKMVKRPLEDYRIIQDIHFSLGGASGGTGKAGTADPVETHVYLKTEEGDDYGREVLDQSEQTCFLHAFCRTDMKAKVRIKRA